MTIMFYVGTDVASKGIQRVNVEPQPLTPIQQQMGAATHYTNLDCVKTGRHYHGNLHQRMTLYHYELFFTMADAKDAAEKIIAEIRKESQEFIDSYERKLKWHKAKIERLSKVKF